MQSSNCFVVVNFYNFDFEKKSKFSNLFRKSTNLYPPRFLKLESSVFYSNQHILLYELQCQNFKSRLGFFAMFENSQCHIFFLKSFFENTVHKKVWDRNSTFWYGSKLIRIKNRAILESLGELDPKIWRWFFRGEPLKVCMQYGNASLYTRLYNVTNGTIYSYYSFTILCAYHNVTL